MLSEYLVNSGAPVPVAIAISVICGIAVAVALSVAVGVMAYKVMKLTDWAGRHRAASRRFPQWRIIAGAAAPSNEKHA